MPRGCNLRKIRICPSSVLTAACLFLLFPAKELLCAAAAVLLHEGGHLLMIALCRTGVHSVTVLPFGAQIRTGPLTAWQECLISAAGGLCNLAAFFCFRERFPVFALHCLVLGVLNLLPVRGLDGGNVTENLLLLFLPPDTAHRICYAVSFITLFVLWVFSAYLLLYGTGNITLFLLCVFLFAQSFLCSP